MKFLLPCFSFIWLYILAGPGSHGSAYVIKPVIYDSVPLKSSSFKIFTNTDHSYGYNVFVYGRLLVHQPSIPGIQGVKGFKRKTDAQKVATLVLRKVQEGFIPPTVGQRELDSLKIKY